MNQQQVADAFERDDALPLKLRGGAGVHHHQRLVGQRELIVAGLLGRHAPQHFALRALHEDDEHQHQRHERQPLTAGQRLHFCAKEAHQRTDRHPQPQHGNKLAPGGAAHALQPLSDRAHAHHALFKGGADGQGIGVGHGASVVPKQMRSIPSG